MHLAGQPPTPRHALLRIVKDVNPMRTLHRKAMEAIDARSTGTGSWDREEAAWDAWAELAEEKGLCLICETPSPGSAYCQKCDADNGGERS